MKNYFVLFFIASKLICNAQVSLVEYGRITAWGKIAQSLPYLSKEEKDRISLTWGRDNNDVDPYILEYDSMQSLYIQNDDKSEPEMRRWRRERSIYHHQYVQKRCLDNIELLGSTFIFDEELPKMKWKIMNDIKEVAGYVCMKATTFDSIKNQNVVAWFSSEIPVSLGPENYYGLPGLILEIDKNNGCCVITASKIELQSSIKEIKIPKKKGKKSSLIKYNTLLSKHIKESIEAQRNPYWGIKY